MKKKRKLELDFSGKLQVRAVVMGSGLPIRVWVTTAPRATLIFRGGEALVAVVVAATASVQHNWHPKICTAVGCRICDFLPARQPSTTTCSCSLRSVGHHRSRNSTRTTTTSKTSSTGSLLAACLGGIIVWSRKGKRIDLVGRRGAST
jgi:hypothetical protein